LEHANSRKIEILESHNIHVLSKHHPSIPYQCTCNVVQSLSIYSHFIKPLATSTFLYTLFSFYAFSDRHLIIIFYIPCCVWQYFLFDIEHETACNIIFHQTMYFGSSLRRKMILPVLKTNWWYLFSVSCFRERFIISHNWSFYCLKAFIFDPSWLLLKIMRL